MPGTPPDHDAAVPSFHGGGPLAAATLTTAPSASPAPACCTGSALPRGASPLSMASSPAWLRPYLDRLGIDDPGEPCVAALFALHRAQVERCSFENIDIVLGRPQGIDPAESVARIIGGRGGYCFNLNGAFATLLSALGYHVTWHMGSVHGPDETPQPAQYGNHLTLTVRLDPITWMADCGLGKAHYDPIPLTAGEHPQGPFTFALAPVASVAGSWRFVDDPALSGFTVDFGLAPAAWTDFLPHHAELSTGPKSPFVRLCQLHRRDAGGADSLLNCILSRTDGGTRTERELTSRADWLDAVTGVFGLRLDSLTAGDHAELWRRVQASHQAWLAEQEASGRG